MIIDHLSPSSITQYLRCSMQWYYRQTLGPKPPGIFLLAGKSAEHGLNNNFLNKIEKGEDLPVNDVKELVAAYWDKDRDNTVFFPGDDEGKKKDVTIERTCLYRVHVAPKIKPKRVQKKFAIKFKNNMPDLVGVIDLLEENKIIDWKTSSKAKKEPDIDHSLQMSIYSMVKDMGTKLELHYINLSAEPEVPINIMEVKPNILIVQKRYLQVLDGITKDVYIPNRAHFLCSFRYCGYYDECHLENG